MIQKRFQYYTREGLAWSNWFNCSKDDSKLEEFQRENKFQLAGKLKNEYRIV